ncbi:MAG: helix-turn-helix transcriptional regulator [Bacilli bacterium]|nr:helix-turn-helix transcriptional regulator [Bacilli bacterium]MBO6194915.1 helix-turn-helix transcriptional regulator [Bacilli bacterium]
MSKIKKVKIEKGYYLFKLEEVLSDKGISINKLMKDTNTDFKVIKRLMNGDMVRIDIIVLARICDYLKCDITDIVEYKR